MVLKNIKKGVYVNLLRKAFDNSVSPIAILDKNFNFVRVNKAYASKDYRQPEEFIGHNHFKLYPSDENKRIFQKVVDTKRPFMILAKPFVYASNTERGITYWDWSLEPIVDDNDDVFLLIFTLNNVTDREASINYLKKEIAQRKLSEAYLKTIFDRAVFGIVTISERTVLLDVNRSFQEMLGYFKEELIGVDFLNIIHPDDKKIISFKKLLNGEIDHYKLEIRFIKKDGSFIWGKLNTVLADYEQANEKYLIAFVKDITDRKKCKKRFSGWIA